MTSSSSPTRRDKVIRILHTLCVSLFLTDGMLAFSVSPLPVGRRGVATKIAQLSTDIETLDSEEHRSWQLEQMLDQSMLLYSRVQRLSESSAITMTWMPEQLTSTIECLSRHMVDQRQPIPHHNNSDEPLPTAAQVALEIEAEILKQHQQQEPSLAKNTQVQDLVELYAYLKDRDSVIESQRVAMKVLQCQLNAWQSLVDSVVPVSPDTSPVHQMVVSQDLSMKVTDDTVALGDAFYVTKVERAIENNNTEIKVEKDREDSDKALSSTAEFTESTNQSGLGPLFPSTTSSPSNNKRPSSSTALQAATDSSDVNDQSVTSLQESESLQSDSALDKEVDIAIVGAGLAGLCAGAILNTVYGKKVGIYETHYLAGGCAHAFDRKTLITNKDGTKSPTTFTFDSGPTILLGCSSKPYSALRQVLDAVGEKVDWIAYGGWGVIENPSKENELRWTVELGPKLFEEGPLAKFGGEKALEEFNGLREATKGLLAGASIPAMAMRPGAKAIIPLLRFFPTLLNLLSQGETTTGTFKPFMDGPLYTVTDPWLRNWLDALAFSLSGLPASRTAAAAMAFVLYDMHRDGAALDYPKGGMGSIVDALVRGVEKGENGSKVHLRKHVERIDCSEDASAVTGITLSNGERITAREGVICNAPVWALRNLIKDERVLARLNGGSVAKDNVPSPPTSWTTTNEGSSIKLDRSGHKDDTGGIPSSFLSACDTAEQTGSFLHLHLALKSEGLDLQALEAHYTVMDRGLDGDGSVVNGIKDGPCGELNMIAVSNPCVIDSSLAPEGFIVVHAYGAGNEPEQVWDGLSRNSEEYKRLKEERAAVLWRAVESIIPDARQRTVISEIGSPVTHKRFLTRSTYGSATEDWLKDPSTPIPTLMVANDGVFPGIGVPSGKSIIFSKLLPAILQLLTGLLCRSSH